ncbi:hypothetical protein ABVT39_007561 [Epinephelus coioides]
MGSTIYEDVEAGIFLRRGEEEEKRVEEANKQAQGRSSSYTEADSSSAPGVGSSRAFPTDFTPQIQLKLLIKATHHLFLSE